ncbi:MAG: serine/threonine protein kinase [Myxococcales bacterium]|nr:serine/threonine protein kinase [Myxococcales bacterium]
MAPGARQCGACGVDLPAEARVRALGAQGGRGAGTLSGAPAVTPVPLDGRTLPESTPPALLAAYAPLDPDAPTVREGALDGLAEALLRAPAQAPPSPAVERMSDLSLGGSDRGQPARRRASVITDPQVSPATAELQPRETVEGYTIEREVGRGGMGRVYRAVHGVTGQTVALKMLLPELADDARLRKRFVNEAQLLAKLEHPNLVPLLGFFETPRGAFIAMPFVEGITLDKMLRRQGRLDIDVALDLVGQLASGLDHMHRQGIMHRDLKPSNVLVRADGKVKITDFGIARAIGAERLTKQGMVVGTAEYLAPEQASGQTFDDVRSEIYSLAVLAYEMLTGRVPFRHQNAAKVLLQHVNKAPPPPRTVRPEIPVGVEATVLQGLAKRPEDRPVSCLAFHAGLMQGLDEDGPTAAEAQVPTPGGELPAITAERSAGGGLTLALQVLLGAGLGAGLAWGAWQIMNALD